MKKPLLMAAALVGATGLVFGSNAKAGDMFSITASSPGAVTFSGQGTAQFNNSLGSNNSFQVGSSTNLGVNASASSTPEYGVTAGAALELGGTTTLKQVIGTSGSDQSKTRSHERAHTVARERQSEAGFGVDYASSSNSGSYENEAAWRVARDSSYSSDYQNAYSAANTNSTSSGSSGTISGSFTTVESGRASTGGQSSEWETSANTAVEASHGSSWGGASSGHATEVEWQASRDSAYEREYAKAASNSNRFSDSSVSVTGIGSDANIAADADSSFKVDIAAKQGSGTAATSTANGAAGASLATSSFANQSNAQTASGFIQAFGGASDTTTGGGSN
jgi:hypothetical protein